MTGAFAQAHIPRNDGVKYLVGEMCLDVVSDLPAEGIATIEHGENQAVNRESSVQVVANKRYCREKRAESLEGVIFALQRDQQGVAGGERVQSHQAERRWAIHDDEIVAITKGCESIAETTLAIFQLHELNLCSDEVLAGTDDLQLWQHGAAQRPVGRRIAQKNVIGRSLSTCKANP